MTAVIKCMGLAGLASNQGSQDAPVGAYLETFDPEAHDGQGDATFTFDLSKAMKFSNPADAWLCWQTVPESRPTRPDGKPNRPLTAFTVEIVSI